MILKIKKSSKKHLSITINKNKKGEVVFLVIPHFKKSIVWITNYIWKESQEITFLFFKLSIRYFE